MALSDEQKTTYVHTVLPTPNCPARPGGGSTDGNVFKKVKKIPKTLLLFLLVRDATQLETRPRRKGDITGVRSTIGRCPGPEPGLSVLVTSYRPRTRGLPLRILDDDRAVHDGALQGDHGCVWLLPGRDRRCVALRMQGAARTATEEEGVGFRRDAVGVWPAGARAIEQRWRPIVRPRGPARRRARGPSRIPWGRMPAHPRMTSSSNEWTSSKDRPTSTESASASSKLLSTFISARRSVLKIVGLKAPWLVRPIETRWNPHVVVVVCVLLVRLIGQLAYLRDSY